MSATDTYLTGTDAVSAWDAERLIEGLKAIPIEEVGTPAWKDQREVVEKLNIQAHYNLSIKRDEYIYEAVCSFEKLVVIVHELLVVEVWKEKIYPLIRDEVRKHPTGAYMFLHYEAVLANLLETLLFNDDAVESLGDVVLELCDWCYRNVLYLNSIPDEDRQIKEVNKDDLINMSDEEHWKQTEKDLKFKVAISAMSVLWMIVDKLNKVHMSVMNNLLLKNDMPLQMVALMSGAPWMRRGYGKFQKFKDGEWKVIPNTELLLLTQTEAHIWLVLHVLLSDPTCRSKYQYDQYRREEILKLRRFVTPRLVDQIPNLEDLQRSLDELQIMEPPSSTEEKFRSSIVVEVMPEIYSSLIKGKNWKFLAQKMKDTVFSSESVDEDVARMSKLIDQFGFDEETGTTAQGTEEATPEEIKIAQALVEEVSQPAQGKSLVQEIEPTPLAPKKTKVLVEEVDDEDEEPVPVVPKKTKVLVEEVDDEDEEDVPPPKSATIEEIDSDVD